MSIFTMKRFWIAVSLPALIVLLIGKNWLILTGVVWLPLSLALLLWAFFTYRSNKKEAEAAKANLQNHQKLQINTPNFDLFGQKYTFVETYSGQVIDTNSQNQSVWVKTNTGDEKQLKKYEVSFRISHRLCIYDLLQQNDDGTRRLFSDALIINQSTGEYKVTLGRKAISIPALLTFVTPKTSTTSYSFAMDVPSTFSLGFYCLCSIAFISFLTVISGFRDGYVWQDHQYALLTYLSSRIGSYIYIKWMKLRSSRFDREIEILVSSLRNTK